MAEQKQWVVTLSKDRPVRDIRTELKKAGFSVDQVMEEIGVVTGRSDEVSAEKVRAMAGVADISSDAPIDIGPPGSPSTW